jgi:hypothetical protein
MEFRSDRHPAAFAEPRQKIFQSRYFTMAIYHMSVKTVSRGKGQSAIAKAAYNARENIRDEQTDEQKNYTRGSAVLFSGIFAPKEAPAWANDRAALWNNVERGEKRKDAQLAREITLGLPHELTDEQRKQLVTDFVREQFQRKGMIADVNIHAPGGKGDDRNYHAHVLLTMREIDQDGFGQKAREWNSREQLEGWREAWERTQNRYLERYGHEARVDRRTLEAQGIDREPTTHLGPHASAIERRKAIEAERGLANREIFYAAQESQKLKRELADIQKQIAGAEREQRQPTAARFQEATRTATERGKDQPPRTMANENRRVGVVLNRGLDKGVNIAGSVLSAATKAIESIFAPPTPPTREQIKEDHQRHERAASEGTAAHQREISEAEYDLTKQRWAQDARDQEQARKDYERYRGDDRDRDRR